MGRKILLVDDNVFNRKFIRDLLSITGLEILEARSCQQGVEMAISQHPRLVFLSSHMAYPHAREVFSILQKIPSTRMIPVICITSKVDEDRAQPCFASISSFDQPVPVQTIVEKIQPYVNAARLLENRVMN